MSLAKFAEGFNTGLRTGTEYGEALVKGRTANGIREANEVLAEMQNMAPVASSNAGIPDGEGGGEGLATGYSGEEWNSMKTRYTQAMKNVSDPVVLDQMMDRMAEMEKGKIMEYGRMALAAIKSGDMAAAQNYIAGVSYFTDPGTTPTVRVTPDGTILASSPGDNPMVLRPENLEEMLHQVVNFEGYRDLAFDKEKHSDMMDYRERTRLDAIANDKARLGLRERELEGQLDRWEQQTALDTQRITAGNKLDQARIDQIRAAMEQDEANFKAGATKAQQERHDKLTEDANSFLEEYLDDPGAFDEGGSGGDDLLGIGGGGVELSGPGQEAVDQAGRVTKVLDAGSAQSIADARNRQAAARETMSDPQTQFDYQSLVSGIAGAENPGMSGTQIGALALASIMSDGSKYEPFFDQKNGLLVMTSVTGGKDYYRVAPSHHGTFARMFDGVPQEQDERQTPGPNPGPEATGIPQEAQP